MPLLCEKANQAPLTPFFLMTEHLSLCVRTRHAENFFFEKARCNNGVASPLSPFLSPFSSLVVHSSSAASRRSQGYSRDFLPLLSLALYHPPPPSPRLENAPGATGYCPASGRSSADHPPRESSSTQPLPRGRKEGFLLKSGTVTSAPHLSTL